MRTLKLTLAYDGTAYAGWQFQPRQPTLQETLERTLKKITGEDIRTIASGRTDAGVHARGQVVGLTTMSELSNAILQRALNAELPDDIAVLWVADAPPGFHPTRDAIRKRYRYQIHDGPVRDVFARRFVWHYRSRLDDRAMHRAAQGLAGKHDFSSFEASGAERATSVRTITHIAVVRGEGDESDRLHLDVEADGFLYNMVRSIVGTLVEVGRGARPETWPAEVLRACDRSCAGPTVPAQGLCLMSVDYD